MNRSDLLLASSILCIVVAPGPAAAGEGVAVRSSGRTSVTSSASVNENVKRNVHIDVDRRGSYQAGGCCYHPVAAAAAVTTTEAVTAAAVGSVSSNLPATCTTVVINEMAYQRCGQTYYQPRISGTSTTYVVVPPPP
jgi:hypothetical protein